MVLASLNDGEGRKGHAASYRTSGNARLEAALGGAGLCVKGISRCSGICSSGKLSWGAPIRIERLLRT